MDVPLDILERGGGGCAGYFFSNVMVVQDIFFLFARYFVFVHLPCTIFFLCLRLCSPPPPPPVKYLMVRPYVVLSRLS